MNPPAVFPTDPHLLAQWRFDERRRSGPGDAMPRRATVVLGRFSDRVEIRNPAEAPDVAESARAIAAETDKPAYRVALLEVAERIAAHFGAAPPAAERVIGADDWLASLDASIASGPAAGNGRPSHPVPPAADASALGDDLLPDFLSGDGWDAPATPPASSDDGETAGPGPGADIPLLPLEPAADETVDDALYLPPSVCDDDLGDVGLDFLSPEPPFARSGDDPWAAEAPDLTREADEAPDGDVRPRPMVAVFSIVAPPADNPPSPPSAPPGPQERAVGAAARLAELGRTLGLTVTGRAVAPSAGEDPLAALDVVWHEAGEVVGAFVVDPPFPLAIALLDLADLVAAGTAVPPLVLVAPEALRAPIRSEAARPVFARLPVPLATACGFLAHEALDRALERAADFLPYLRPGFVLALAERLDG